MKIYLAAALRFKERVAEFARQIPSPHVVTSRWLYEHPCPEDPCPEDPDEKEKFLRETALMDLADIREADVIVRFSDIEVISQYVKLVPRDLATGARHFEVGYALAQGKPVIVVGGCQNVFDHLPNILHLKDGEALLQYLNMGPKR